MIHQTRLQEFLHFPVLHPAMDVISIAQLPDTLQVILFIVSATGLKTIGASQIMTGEPLLSSKGKYGYSNMFLLLFQPQSNWEKSAYQRKGSFLL
jgi:hypothetical protein